MFDLFKSKKEEIVEEKSTNNVVRNVIRIESDEELIKKSRTVFRDEKNIGEIHYKDGEWFFQARINHGSYFPWAESVNERTLQIILDEIKKLNLIHK